MATSTTTSNTSAVTSRDMKSKLYLSMPRIPPKVYLSTVNPHITCNLCKGYLIDATTIVECLHSFCHSCIMMHLRRETYCPSCEMMINKVKPNIKPDATLQAIVYKLVPGLYEKELLRRRAFYKLRPKEASEATPEQRGEDTEHLIFGPNESISLMIEYSDNDSALQNSDDENSNSSHEINSSDHCEDDFEVQLRKPKYLQCPAQFTISNLKKFLLHKFGINPNKFCVEIMYKVKSLVLHDHYTLMDVAYIFTWKRDAPMKFLYCVRAAHSPVANIEQSAVMYDLPSNHFKSNTQLVCASDSTDHEQDQSSDADSEVRSERAKEIPETNGSTSRHEPINSTSDEPSRAPSSSTSTSMNNMSSAAVTSTSVANTSSKSNAANHTSVNGSENQKKESSATKDQVSSPTTSGRTDITLRIKSEPLSPSPEKPSSDRRSNGASPKPNTSKSRSTTDTKPSSPSRTNQDLKDSKEKVKTKSIMLDSSATKSGDSTLNRSEPKMVTFSDRPPSSSSLSSSSLRPSGESKPTSSTERPMGRLLFNKEETAKSLSPPISAENEYDFDQHLLKEEFSTKKDFFEKIHLKPRTDSPLVQLPKMPKTEQKSDTTIQTTNLSSKDKDTSKPSSAATSTTTATTPSVSSFRSPSVSSSKNFSAKLAAHIANDEARRAENKTSKRKSREPVKNVTKAKSASPNEHAIDIKWDPNKLTVSPSPFISTVNATSSGSNSNAGDRNRRIQDSSQGPIQQLIFAAQQNKSNLKSFKNSASSSSTKSNQASSSTSTNPLSSSLLSSKPVFKTPTTSSFKESSSIGFKSTPSESGTSIIINNIQRPTQADTPRPSMSFKPDISSLPQPIYYQPTRRFNNYETEIQEIRTDDASKGTVYGPTMPAMNLPKQNEHNISSFKTALLANNFLNRVQPLLNFPSEPANMFNFQLMGLPRPFPMCNKPNKLKKQLDAKRPSATTNLESKANSLQKSIHLPRSIIDIIGKVPEALDIFETNEENEQSSFSMKTTSVQNSIEIVKLPKLPQDTCNEPNSKFPSQSSSSSTSSTSVSIMDKPWQSNKNANSQTKHTMNQQIDQSNSKDFQSKFIETLISKPKEQPNGPQTLNKDELNRCEAQKRKQQQQMNEEKAKVRKLQQPVPQQRSSPTTQRPVPLLIPKDDRKVSISNSGSSSGIGGSSQPSSSGSLAINKNISKDGQSPTVSLNAIERTAALTLAVAQAKVQQAANEIPTSKYQPIQTSHTPLWKKYCTAEDTASHETLECLMQPKKNSGTIVD